MAIYYKVFVNREKGWMRIIVDAKSREADCEWVKNIYGNLNIGGEI